MAVTRLTTNGLTGTKYDIASADNYYMEPIATNLVGAGGVASIAFTNIPQGYKHLQIRAIARNTVASTGAEAVIFQVNGDTSSSYAYHKLERVNVLNSGNPSSSASTSQTNIYTGVSTEGSELASVFAPMITDILDYANTNKNKTFRTLYGMNTNGGTDVLGLRSGLWMNTAPITSINITSSGGNFAQHTRLSLYGIKG
jgi:predicted phage tail protein